MAKSLRPNQFVQALKVILIKPVARDYSLNVNPVSIQAVCAFLGNIETLDIREMCENLLDSCNKLEKAAGGTELRKEIADEVGIRKNS